MTTRKRFKCRFCNHVLPAWLPVAKRVNSAMLLHHLGQDHRDQMGPYLARMETECIDTVVGRGLRGRRGGGYIGRMGPAHLSHIQRRILAWLAAEEQRTRSTMNASHEDLVHALAHDKGNLSHSLANLKAKGLIHITRTTGGKAEAVDLTPEGRQRVAQLMGSCEYALALNNHAQSGARSHHEGAGARGSGAGAGGGGVEFKDVVNLAFHEFFERGHYLPEETP